MTIALNQKKSCGCPRGKTKVDLEDHDGDTARDQGVGLFTRTFPFVD